MALFFCGVLCISWIYPIHITEAAKSTITVKTDDLNVRSGPSLNHDIITTLKKGEKYPLVKENGDWMQIALSKKKKGWVAGYLVTQNKEDIILTSTSETEKKEPTSSKTGIITVDSLNIRSKPALNGEIIGKLQKNSSVEIISETNDWIEILYNGQSAWISDLYIEETNSEVDHKSSEQLPADSHLTILYNGTNIRKQPNTQSAILERASSGNTYEAVRLANDWYEILLSDGQTGYVASWLITTESSTTQSKKQGLDQYLQNKKIVIDPGHGGKDDGATGAKGTLEKEVTMQTAEYLYKKLKAAGANVILTRNFDKYTTLPKRVGVANYQDADAFISIHYDSNKDKSVRGMTTYFYHPWQKEIAVDIHSAVIDQIKTTDRGTQFGDYYVIRENKKNAILIELGYLSNPTEELLVKTDQYQESAATGIYEGLARYFKEN
jgi:N-acetylmuramoyl-L-alanine amidase